jgi:hypothetical protein
MNVADLFKNPPPKWTEPDNALRVSTVAWAEPLGDDIERALATCPVGAMLMILAGTELFSGDEGLLRENVVSAMRNELSEAARARLLRAFRSIGDAPAPKPTTIKTKMADFLRLGGEPRALSAFISKAIHKDLNVN